MASTSSSSPSPTPAFTGRCHCGAVRFASTSPPQNLTYCYCITCRRLSGSPFMAWADIPFSAFKLDTQSSDPSNCALRPLSSDLAVRSVCKKCGSSITMKYFCDENIGVAAGTIEEGSFAKRRGDGVEKVTEHIFMGEKAGWYEVPEDGVKRWEGFSEGFEKKLRAWKKGKEQP